MSKLTDSEGEYQPADAEDSGQEDFFDQLYESDNSLTNEPIARPKHALKRDLAEGQNLNNSFGFYSPDDWDHLHQDKGMNPQFHVLKGPAPMRNNYI